VNRYVTIVGVLSAVVAFFSPEFAQWFPNGWSADSQWWAVLPLLALFVYGFLRALQERFEGLEQKLEIDRKRKDTKDLLGEMMKEGRNLRSYDKATRRAQLPRRLKMDRIHS
jgi:cyanate permease